MPSGSVPHGMFLCLLPPADILTADSIHVRLKPTGALHSRWSLPLVPMWAERRCRAFRGRDHGPERYVATQQDAECPAAASVGVLRLQAHSGEGGPTHCSGAVVGGKSWAYNFEFVAVVKGLLCFWVFAWFHCSHVCVCIDATYLQFNSHSCGQSLRGWSSSCSARKARTDGATRSNSCFSKKDVAKDRLSVNILAWVHLEI